MTIAYRNTIRGFRGSWGSGLATLAFEDGTCVHSDNAPLARALDGAFDAIGEGHIIDNSKIEGQVIVWFLDDFGLTLAGFITYADWLEAGNPELVTGANEIIVEGEEVSLAAVDLEA